MFRVAARARRCTGVSVDGRVGGRASAAVRVGPLLRDKLRHDKLLRDEAALPAQDRVSCPLRQDERVLAVALASCAVVPGLAERQTRTAGIAVGHETAVQP